MQVPSGAKYTNEDLDILAMMSKCGFVRRSDEPFKLASGIMSHVYVFGREDLTDNPQLASLIGLKLARVVYDNTDLDESRQQCLIGVPVAGNTLAQAASLSSLSLLKEMAWTAQPIGHRVMREQPKQHGAHKKVWIDRQQGAVPRLTAAGFQKIVVVYNLLDITYAYGELGMWSKTAVAAVEEEIKAHQ